jgi:hypothetical protein
VLLSKLDTGVTMMAAVTLEDDMDSWSADEGQHGLKSVRGRPAIVDEPYEASVTAGTACPGTTITAAGTMKLIPDHA